MEKAVVSNEGKRKLKGANPESLQHTESSTEETDFAQLFQASNAFFRSDGRGFDLSRVPGRAGLESGLGIQACTKGSEPCSCAACSAESTADIDEGNKGDQQQQPRSEEPATKWDTLRGVSTEEKDNAVIKPQGTASQDQSAPLIVEDSAADLANGQLRKTDFLLQLDQEIRRAIEPVLVSVGQTSNGCPFLESWIASYRNKDVAHIERTVRRYTPGAASATSTSEYISAIGQRAVQMVGIWARLGMLSGTLSNIPAAARVADDPDALLEEFGKINLVEEIRAKGTLPKATVQPKAKAGGARHTDDPVAIQEELGDGQPLASEVRSRMEPAFGMSFAHVRSHTGAVASTLTNKLNARAFAVGKHVAFGAGEYAPGTPMGDALIAHELAHVAQQKNASGSVNALDTDGTGYNALETDADQVATSVVTSLWRDKVGWKRMVQCAVPGLRSGLKIQRCASNTTSARPTTPAAPQAADRCPTSVVLESSQDVTAAALARGGYRTGYGIISTMHLLPDSTDWSSAQVFERVTLATSTCPSTWNLCTGGREAFPINQPRHSYGAEGELPAQRNRFYDFHVSRWQRSRLHDSEQNPDGLNECSATCDQSYVCGDRVLGRFQVTRTFRKAVVNGRDVTEVTATKRAVP